MKVTGLGYIILNVDNLDETPVWYANNLGYTKELAGFSLDYDNFVADYKVVLNPNGGLPIVFRMPRNVKFRSVDDPDIERLGVLGIKIKTPKVRRAYLGMKYDGIGIKSGLAFTPPGNESFWIRDAGGLMIQIIDDQHCLENEKDLYTAGVEGVILGVPDLDSAIDFYAKLGYKRVLFKGKSNFDDLKAFNNNNKDFNRAVLMASNRNTQLYNLFGVTYIDLIETTTDNSKVVKQGNNVKGLYKFGFLATESEKKPAFMPFNGYRTLDTDYFSLVYSPAEFAAAHFYLTEIFSVSFRKVLNLNLKKKYSYGSVPKRKVNFLLNNAMYNLI